METPVGDMSLTQIPPTSPLKEQHESASLGPIQTPLGKIGQGVRMPKAQRLKSLCGEKAPLELSQLGTS